MYPETYSIWRFIHEPFPMEFHHHCLLFIHCARGRGDTHSEYVKNKINQNYHSVQIWSYQYLYGFLHGSVEQSSSSVKLRDSLIGQHVVGATPTRWCRNPPRTNHGGARGLESLVCRRREQGRQVRFAIEHVGHVHLDQVEHGFKVVDFLRWVWVLRLSGNVAGPLQWSEVKCNQHQLSLSYSDYSQIYYPLSKFSLLPRISHQRQRQRQRQRQQAATQPRHLVWPVGHEGFERSIM